MKLYFLLEDQKSFCRVLPYWLKYLYPQWNEANSVSELADKKNAFLIESGFGYPNIKKVLKSKLTTFKAEHLIPDYVVVCFDTDGKPEFEVKEMREEFESIFQQVNISCPYFILPMQICFETWLLGNRMVYPQEITDDFLPFANFYPVNRLDPEEMKKPADAEETVPMYHYFYLRRMIKAGAGKNYTKGRPGYVTNPEYLEALLSRIKETDDLQTFRSFIHFLDNMNNEFLTE